MGTEKAKLLRLRASQTGITATALVLQPRTHAAKGTVIFLCGNGSTPERAVGAGPEDYQRFVAKRLCDEGYAVYVPYLLTLAANNASIDRLALPFGLTHVHFDIWRLKALVDHLAVKEQRTIWLYGISHGGFNALLYAAVDERIPGVICSGSLCDSLAMLRHYIKVSGDAATLSARRLDRPRSGRGRRRGARGAGSPEETGVRAGRPTTCGPRQRRSSIASSRVMIRPAAQARLELLLFDGFHEINLQMTLPLSGSLVLAGEEPMKGLLRRLLKPRRTLSPEAVRLLLARTHDRYDPGDYWRFSADRPIPAPLSRSLRTMADTALAQRRAGRRLVRCVRDLGTGAGHAADTETIASST